MLDRLDRIDWNRVQDACGPATEVPVLLRALLSEKAPERRRARLGLEDSLNHQSAITPAAVPATPFLVEIATSEKVKDRASLLFFLAELAVRGNPIKYITTGYHVRDKAFADCPPEHPYKAIYLSVAAGFDAYLTYLCAKEAPVRTASAFLLAFLTHDAERSAPLIRQRIEKETSAPAKASLLLSLAHLDMALGSQQDAELFRAVAEQSSGLVSLCAWMALSLVAAGDLPDQGVQALLQTASAPIPALKEFPWCQGELNHLASLMLAEVAVYTPQLELIDKLFEATQKLPTQVRVASRLLDAVFAEPEKALPTLRLAHEMTEYQRAFLIKVVERGLVPSLRAGLQRHHLLDREGGLRRMLGLVPAGPLEREVGGQPLWLLGLEVISGQKPEEAWFSALSELSPEQVLAVCEDSVRTPTYALGLPYPTPGSESIREQNRREARFQSFLTETLVRLVPLPLLEQAAEKAQENLGQFAKSWPPALAAALFRLRAAQAKPWPPHWTPLLQAALRDAYADALWPLLETLPLELREALILPMRITHLSVPLQRSRGECDVLGAWHYAGCCPTPAVAEKVADAIASWTREKLPIPRAKALQVLGQLGPVALGPIENALKKAQLPQAREVLEQAASQIRNAPRPSPLR